MRHDPRRQRALRRAAFGVCAGDVESNGVDIAGRAAVRELVETSPSYADAAIERKTSYQWLREIDSGKLVLSGKQIIFAGSSATKRASLSDLVKVDASDDILILSSASRDKALIFKLPEPPTWHAAIQAVSRMQLSGRTLPDNVNLDIA